MTSAPAGAAPPSPVGSPSAPAGAASSDSAPSVCGSPPFAALGGGVVALTSDFRTFEGDLSSDCESAFRFPCS